jgi:uncharacterized membrane protein YphA (DoxX/SURF4 family)
VVIYKNIQSFGLLNRIVSLLFAIEIISAFIIVNTSNTIILPKGYEWGCYLKILFMAISIALLLTELGRFSIGWNIIKPELVF